MLDRVGFSKGSQLRGIKKDFVRVVSYAGSSRLFIG